MKMSKNCAPSWQPPRKKPQKKKKKKNDAGCPSIRAKALSRHSCPGRCASTAFFAREVEDQDPGNLTLNHSAAEHRSTNHRFDQLVGHDSSMRTSRPRARDARAPNQFCGLACADQGHPRAALDANDFRIRLLGAQHPVQSYGQ